jgi:molybdate transport system regulatory protein
MPPRKPSGPQLRILLGNAIAIGPGKADLLEAIARTGSIAAAGRALGMSYRRAWLLVETMNQSFRTPLVGAAKGGKRGGGATLTANGAEVLARYRSMETRARRLLSRDMTRFAALLKPGRLPG